MKYSLLFLTLYCSLLSVGSTATAQTAHYADSLSTVLDNAGENHKLSILDTLCDYFRNTDMEKSNELADREIALARKLHVNEFLVHGLRWKGRNSEQQGALDKAIEYYLEALRISEESKIPALTKLMLNDIGAVHYDMHQYDEAESYWERSLKLSEELKDTLQAGIQLLNLGVLYSDMKKYDKAKIEYDSAMSIFSRFKDSSNMISGYIDIGNLVQKTDSSGKNALAYYQHALQLSRQTNDQEDQLVAEMDLAETYTNNAECRKALPFFDTSLQIARKMHYMAAVIQVYRGRAVVYEKLNDFKKAYFWQMAYNDANDSMLNENSQKQIAELETKYKTAQKEKEIQKQEVQLQKSRNSIFLLTLVLIAVLFSAVLAILFFRRKKIVAAELAKAKSTFFSNVAHDFRTPIALITGPLEQVIYETQDEALRIKLAMPLRNANYILKLINQLLDVSKLESGVMKKNESLGDLVMFVTEVIDHLRPLAAAKSIRLSFSHPDTQLDAWFDADAIEKIIYNLVTNAIKFTAAGGYIDVRLDAEKGKSQFDISVKDNGIGISAKDQEKLFTRFFRSRRAQSIPGIGLGLSLVKGLTDLNDGKITVTSEPGKGSEFRVSMPLRISSAADGEGEEENEAEEPIIALVIEDNADMLSFVSSLIEGVGIKVIGCQDGKTGLAKAKEILPDIIITDIMLPDINGYEITKTIKKDPATDHIPVIMLTAKTRLEQRIEGIEMGADAYIAKPFNPQELIGLIGNLLALRKNMQKRYAQKTDDGDAVLTDTVESLKSMENKFVDAAILIIEKNISEEAFSVDILSKQMFLSRAQFHRKLKVLTGFSASQLIRAIRLEKAYDLLKKDEGNVTEIAYMTGFSSQPYFTKCFTEYFGYSPKEVK